MARKVQLDLDFERLLWDFPYYCAVLLRIDTKSQGLRPLYLNQSQKILWYGRPKQDHPRYRHAVIPEHGWRHCVLQGHPIRQVILKYRQGGISTACMALAFHGVHTNFGKRAMAIAHDRETSEHLLGMAKIFYQYLPPQCQPKIAAKNERRLVFADPKGGSSLHSSIAIETAGHMGSGHGRTISYLICSEIARWDQPESVLDGVTETVPKGVDAPGTAIIFESTAEWASDFFHNQYMQARSGESGYDAVFLPWYLCEWYREPANPDIITPEFREMQKEFGLDDEQITWYVNEIIRQENNHPGRGEKFVRRLYPSTEEEAFIVAGFSVFPEKGMEYLSLKTKRDPIAEADIYGGRLHFRKGGTLKIWEKPRSDSLYLIGVDVSQGVEKSASAVEVFAHPGYRQVAEWTSASVDARALAHVIAPIGRYYNNAVVAVEVNNGPGLLTNTELNNIYGYVYRWKFFDRLTPSTKTQTLGWNTTHESKNLMVHHMCSLLSASPPLVQIRSAALISQMNLFQEYPGYQFRAAPGCRDDLVMAALIACICLYQEYARHDAKYFFGREEEEPKPDLWEGEVDNWDPGDDDYAAPSSWLLN